MTAREVMSRLGISRTRVQQLRVVLGARLVRGMVPHLVFDDAAVEAYAAGRRLVPRVTIVEACTDLPTTCAHTLQPGTDPTRCSQCRAVVVDRVTSRAAIDDAPLAMPSRAASIHGQSHSARGHR